MIGQSFSIHLYLRNMGTPSLCMTDDICIHPNGIQRVEFYETELRESANELDMFEEGLHEVRKRREANPPSLPTMIPFSKHVRIFFVSAFGEKL